MFQEQANSMLYCSTGHPLYVEIQPGSSNSRDSIVAVIRTCILLKANLTFDNRGKGAERQ
jgi:hypothetical protein